MISKPLVFVSSTSKLGDERRALRDEIPRIYELYLYEEDRARRTSPEEHCRNMIERSDVFLGVLGPDYGSPFPDSADSRSIVEWEHEIALGREELEILTFVKQLPAGETRDPRQEAFIARVSRFRDGLWRQDFRTSLELAERARAGLEQWLAEFWTAVQDRREALRRKVAPVLLGVSGLSVLSLVGLFASGARAAMMPAAFVGLCISVACVVALSGGISIWLLGGTHERL